MVNKTGFQKPTYFIEDVSDKKEEKEKPKINEVYYTDEKGNRIKENNFEPDTIIYVVVKGKNLAGKIGDLELSNTKVDFEHKGVYLENDILENYTLKSDYNRIELKVIKPKSEKQ